MHWQKPTILAEKQHILRGRRFLNPAWIPHKFQEWNSQKFQWSLNMQEFKTRKTWKVTQKTWSTGKISRKNNLENSDNSELDYTDLVNLENSELDYTDEVDSEISNEDAGMNKTSDEMNYNTELLELDNNQKFGINVQVLDQVTTETTNWMHIQKWRIIMQVTRTFWIFKQAWTIDMVSEVEIKILDQEKKCSPTNGVMHSWLWNYSIVCYSRPEAFWACSWSTSTYRTLAITLMKKNEQKHQHELTVKEQVDAHRFLIFIKETHTSPIKVRGCSDGSKQRLVIQKIDTTSPNSL